MKKLSVFIVFLIIISNLALAKTIEEDVFDDQSIQVPGYNITLLTIGSNEKSIVACINNEKYIINKDSRKEFENLKVEPTRIYEDYARLRITYSCEECVCNESCSNSLCFKEEEDTIEEIINENEEKDNNIEKKEDIKSASILLFLIVLILLALLVIKRKRGR